ncbi:hypothetical protein AAVH_17448 [Aphelenchoides avenae]|nr:hypothetical protein AAVH_17448 [Aphelenchus avenae]
MAYARDTCEMHFFFGGDDVAGSRSLIAELIDLEKMTNGNNYGDTTTHDEHWLSVIAYSLLSAKVATLLCANGFKLDGMSDKQWVFVKQA